MYLDGKGQRISDPETLDRITTLRIPPAWHEVVICSSPQGHLQAVGYDAKGRKQYIYHAQWAAQQQQHKFDKMIAFVKALPKLREQVEKDMRKTGLPKEKVVATVIWLLDNTFIRVGNQEYAKENGSYGLTTLREKHVELDGQRVQFAFKGKSGVEHLVDIQDPRVARIIQKCIEVPGYELFQYYDEEGKRQLVDSKDVNEYLQIHSGEECTAKDFRTWGGTVLATTHLHKLGPADSQKQLKKNLTATVKAVAIHLRNTPATCRKYYIYPCAMECYESSLLCEKYLSWMKESSQDSFLTKEEFVAWRLITEYVSK